MSAIHINNSFISLQETADRIERGEFLVIAGDKQLLKQLPEGHWIGGSIPYFLTEEGGVKSTERLYVTQFKIPEDQDGIRIRSYSESSIEDVCSDTFENGFTFLILPGFTDVQQVYANEASTFEGMYITPIVGWVSGYDMDGDDDKGSCFIGSKAGMATHDEAVAIHVKLPSSVEASIKMISPFKESVSSAITFLQDGFRVKDCLIDGEKVNFSDFLVENNVDTKLPIIQNCSGTCVNVSVRENDTDSKRVRLFAPVVQGQEYRLAEPVDDYLSSIEKEWSEQSLEGLVFSCSCILNYLYSELEGKQTKPFFGPITFGEIGYQLLNQTTVALCVK